MDGRYRKDGDQASQHDDGRPTTSSSSSTASRSLSPISTFTPIYPPGGNTTPLKFATSTNAFNLAVSPTSSSSSGREGQHGSMMLTNERSPPQAGTSTTRRLRRPSMLALSQPTGPAEVNMSRENSGQDGVGGGGPDQGGESVSPHTRLNDVSPTDTRSNPFGFGQATSRWNPSGSLFNTSLNAAAFAHSNSGQGGIAPLGIPDSKNLTPPRLHSAAEMDDGSRGDSQSPFDMEMGEEQRSPLRFLPSHLQTSASRRKGKGKMDDQDLLPLGTPITGPPGSTPHPEGETAPPPKPFNRKPLPANLVATLISENAPLEHEIQSEARLQRFIHSHPPRLPLTPRISKSTRGRFPEMADNEDDDEDDRRPSWRGRQWMGMRSDSDSDSDDDGEPVNSAFAAGMDLDRPMSMSSSSSSAVWPSGNVSESGKMTPGGLAPGPAGGVAGAGGPASLAGVAGIGNGSGNGQPTPPPGNTTWGGGQRPSRLSFGAGLIPSPGTGFQLPGAFGGLGMGGGGTPLGSPTVERLDLLGASPGAVSSSSPSLMAYRESQGGSASVRPGKRKAQPDDRFDPYKRPRGSSPSLAPMSPSQRATSIPIPSSPFAASNSTRRTYASRPLSSRSRQASPALSIGSTSGVLSTSLGNSVGKAVGGSFMPTGPAAAHAAHQAQGPHLGGLGLLSLANVGEDVEGEGAAEGNSRGSSTRPSRSGSGSGSRLGQNIDLDQEGDGDEEVEDDEDEDEDAMEED